LPRSGSKQALIVAMLTKDKGATLAALVEATGGDRRRHGR
jgi:hypothetical protein